MLDKDRNYDALVYLIKYLKSIGCKLDGPAHADIRAIAKELVQCASGTRLDRKAIVKRLGLSRAQVYKLAKDLEFGTQRNGTFDARKVDAYKAKMKPNKRREDKSARAKGRKNNRAFLSSLSTDD
jgi:predicted DNA-binding transcriptional regulator AlpA